ncbi:MAG TPA: TIGR03435 family protein [Phycisphaerae bacterium]|nr:TIGR03435 family protein [Phycisphaerae bacterium]
MRSRCIVVVLCATAHPSFLRAEPGESPSKQAARPPVIQVGQADLVGKPAPALTIEKFLQAPPRVVPSWESLKGKCVVLEFWATWCAPCVGAIPHMNELAGRFKDKPIVFISVTHEPEAKIIPFLKRRSMSSWIGLDTDRSFFRDYNVKGIPHTVLVDARGTVAAIGYPHDVTVEALESLISGKPVILRPAEDERPVVPAKREEPVAAEPMFEIVIRPTAEGFGAGTTIGVGKMSLVSNPPLNLLSSVYQTPAYLVDLRATLPDGYYDVVASLPAGKAEQLYPLLRRATETAFGITTRRERRESDVYVLTLPEGGSSLLKPTAMASGGSGTRSSTDKIELTGETLKRLAALLGTRLSTPVIDETGLAGRYDIKLKWEGDGPEPVIQAVEQTLGLELRPARRRVEFLVVENESRGGERSHDDIED